VSDGLPEPRYDGLPEVAVIFAIVLLVAGLWSSKRKHSKGDKEMMARMKAFVFTSPPFALAEAGTGILSVSAGLLSNRHSFLEPEPRGRAVRRPVGTEDRNMTK